MRAYTGDIVTRLAREALNVCHILDVTSRDGTIEKRWTDHDADIVEGGNTYSAAHGFSRTAIETKSDLSVGGFDIRVHPDAISSLEIDTGRLDYANAILRLVDYTAPDAGAIELFRGILGEVTIADDGFYVVEVRGHTQRLAQNIGELYSTTCRADLGDGACAVNLAPFRVTGTIIRALSRAIFDVTISGTPATGYLNLGVLKWTSGRNASLAYEVRSWDAGTNRLILYLPAAAEVLPGDEFEVTPGCDKQFSTCRDQFDNAVNFQGEPFIPSAQDLQQAGVNVAVHAFSASDAQQDLLDAGSQTLQGPRAVDYLGLKAAVGEPIPIVFGRVNLGGNVLWARVRRTLRRGSNPDYGEDYDYEYVGDVENEPELVQVRATRRSTGNVSMIIQVASEWDRTQGPPMYRPRNAVSTISDSRFVNNLNGDVSGRSYTPGEGPLSDEEFCERALDCGFTFEDFPDDDTSGIGSEIPAGDGGPLGSGDPGGGFGELDDPGPGGGGPGGGSGAFVKGEVIEQHNGHDHVHHFVDEFRAPHLEELHEQRGIDSLRAVIAGGG